MLSSVRAGLAAALFALPLLPVLAADKAFERQASTTLRSSLKRRSRTTPAR